MGHSENKDVYRISKLKGPENVVQWKEDFASLAQAEKPNLYDDKYLMVKP
jgi:hypothetical protein